ncbi:MAG: hypothetical protein IJ088_03485 [Clostridia bacterium]|nr:hypothetical protein [Clostridia bacterium]
MTNKDNTSGTIGLQAADIAKQAIVQNRSVRDIILEKEILHEEEVQRILDSMRMTEPGIEQK